MSAPPEVTVMGAGAVGGYVAARLAGAGIDVLACDSNREHVEAIREGGLRVSGEADLRQKLRAVTPEELPDQLGTVLLAVKTVGTATALDAIAPRLSAPGFVVSLQNGLQEYAIAERVGAARTVGASLTFGGHYVQPGEIVYGGPGSLRLGELDGSLSDRLASLIRLLAPAHPADVTANIFGYLWSKSAIGAFYFASALSDLDVQDLLASEVHRPALSALVAEVALIADAEGIRCEQVDGFSTEAFRTRDAAGIDASWQAHLRYWNRHASRRTGIWRDLAVHHRQTEVGGILDRAARRGLPSPLLARTAAMVREAEAGARRLGPANLDELAGLTVPQAPTYQFAYRLARDL